MRRPCVFVLASVMALANIGCILVLGVKDVPHRKQVVEIDGELYILDVKTHRVRKVGEDRVIEAETTTEAEAKAAED